MAAIHLSEKVPMSASRVLFCGAEMSVAAMTAKTAAEEPRSNDVDSGAKRVENEMKHMAPAIPPNRKPAVTHFRPAISSSSALNHASHRQLMSKCQKSMWMNMYVIIVHGAANASSGLAGRVSNPKRYSTDWLPGETSHISLRIRKTAMSTMTNRIGDVGESVRNMGRL